ncbi:MAG TPA: glycosyltransferase [Gemmataceae bacterium]|jgi:glycosyltransferase involved in cell wall biosynthesis
MTSGRVASACWLLPDLGHYHHPRIRAAAAAGSAYVLEIHDRPGFAEFRYVPGADAGYEVVRVRESIPASLDRLRPSVVFLNGWAEGGALAGLRWCMRTGTPAVVMSESTRYDSIGDRESDPGRPVRRRWWREAVKRRLVRQFSAALVGGTPHRDYIVELGMAPDRAFDGYDVVDNDYYAAGAAAAGAAAAAARAKHALPERYFLASARFIAKKNLLRLIRAYAAYRAAAGPGAWDLVLLGDGPEKPAVVGLVEELGVRGTVHLPGFQPFAELPAFYGLAGAFVHASTTEQWGLVVNEAMAAGLPVVVSRACGCAADLVTDGVTGFTFDPYDVAAMTRALSTVAAPDFDRSAMGRAARARVAEWSPARFAANFWRAADAAVRAGPRPPRLVSRLILSALGR